MDNFEAARNWDDGNAGRVRGDHGARGGADGANVRSRRSGRQIRTEMELRSEEDDPEEQR